MNKKGVTLLELLVYIGLFAVISLLIGSQFKTLVNNYSTGKKISRQQTDTRDILGIMVREIRNTGLKTYFTGTTTLVKITQPGIIVAPGADLSSFNHTQTNPGPAYDMLEILKIQLDDDGTYDRTDTIKYYVNGTTLRRDLKSSKIPRHTNSVVAENVYALQFQYGVLLTNDLLFDQIPISAPSSWGLTNLTGTAPTRTNGTNSITLTFSGAATGHLKYNTACAVTMNQKYKALLPIDPSGGFPANLTWLQVSFQNTGHTTSYGSEKFKPYAAGDTMSITVPVHTTNNSANTYLDYSTGGAGTLVIKGIEVRSSKLGAYNWVYNPTTAQKANVQAIRLYVLTRSRDKAASAVATSIMVGEVSVPRSGDYTWRLYTETVETPNNGIL